MKPTLQNINNGRTRAEGRNFPVTDFNYHAVASMASTGDARMLTLLRSAASAAIISTPKRKTIFWPKPLSLPGSC